MTSTPIYNEVLKSVGSHYRITSVLSITEEFDGGFALTRSESMGAFDDNEVRRLEFLLPHIVRALKLQQRMRRLEREAHNLAAALDGLPTAALLVSDALKIIHLNRQADELLASCSTLRVRRGQLVPERASETSALRKAVAEAMALADGDIDAPMTPPQVVAIAREGKAPLEALAVPLRPRYELRQQTEEEARALLLLYDPQARPSIDAGLVEDLFDLTTTEAFVAARLAEGRSIAEIADIRRCSPATVRTHVKHIFHKTQTNRQGELVHLILTSPAISFGA